MPSPNPHPWAGARAALHARVLATRARIVAELTAIEAMGGSPSRATLARRLDLSDDVVSRQCKALAAEGVVEVRRGSVRLRRGD